MKLRRRAVAPTLWDLVEAFYLARAQFQAVHERYESRVLAHAKERGVDRTILRLEASEVSKLLDFGKLELLRNGPLHDVKEIAHHLFRRRASTDKLDRYTSEIFHELSILKEEQYKVSTFAPEYHKRNELEEYESILDEVHEEFPKKIRNIHELFEKARWRLEAILRKAREDKVLVRSLALFGEKLVEGAYPLGLRSLLWLMYPGGPVEAHLVAARSFAQSGFAAQALAQAEKAVAALADSPPDDADPDADLLEQLAAEAREVLPRIRGRSSVDLLAEFPDPTREDPRPLESSAPGNGGAATEGSPSDGRASGDGRVSGEGRVSGDGRISGEGPIGGDAGDGTGDDDVPPGSAEDLDDGEVPVGEARPGEPDGA